MAWQPHTFRGGVDKNWGGQGPRLHENIISNMQCPTLRILRVRALPQSQGSGVFLVHAHEVLRDLRRLAHQDNHEARRHRIQGAGMTHLFHVKNSPHPIHN